MTKRLPAFGESAYFRVDPETRELIDATTRLEEAQEQFDALEFRYRHAHDQAAAQIRHSEDEEVYRWIQGVSYMLWDMYCDARRRALAMVEAEEARWATEDAAAPPYDDSDDEKDV